MSLFERVADLPVRIEGCDLERRERETSSGFERVTTVVALRGGGHAGYGEDVTYEADEHDALLDRGVEFAGEYTVGTASDALGDLDMFPEPPERDVFRRYRRWGFESAVLDLALKQAGTTLAGALDRDPRPVRFVVSTRLGDPPAADRVREWLEVDPGIEFKLDATPEWSDDLIEELADTGRVRVLDLKGQYEGTDVDAEPDPGLYRRLVRAFPDAVIEDPAVTEGTRPALEAAADRLSWDAPVHGVDDVRDLPWEPRWLNVKPSRFGAVEELFDCIEYAEERGIRMYGGGQFELGPGREGIQALASLFYPDGPNDVAPRGYNDPEPSAGLASSPLDPPVGFGPR